jgi:hypothetical protein
MVNNLENRQKLGWGFIFTILPTLVVISLTGIPTLEEIVVLLSSGSAGSTGYYLIRARGFSPLTSTAVGLLATVFISFIAIITLTNPNGNVFEIYRPYYSAISAWALPTIMWQEVLWHAEGKYLGDRSSSEVVFSRYRMVF